jgi:hypothetical protein
MPHEPKTVAGVEIVPLCDAVGPMGGRIRRPLPELFPGAALDPDAEWILHFHCYLLRAGSRTVLVDTGIGGAGSPAASWAPVPGRLGEELAAAGCSPAEIDVVVLTHLHSDHASGSVVAGEPAFPNARFVIQQAELDSVAGAMRDRVVVPLQDRIQAVSGHAELLPGIRLLHTPGTRRATSVWRWGRWCSPAMWCSTPFSSPTPRSRTGTTTTRSRPSAAVPGSSAGPPSSPPPTSPTRSSAWASGSDGRRRRWHVPG